jgi:hypothetical protein
MKGWGAPGQRGVPFPDGNPLAKDRAVPYSKKDDMNENQEFRALIM